MAEMIVKYKILPNLAEIDENSFKNRIEDITKNFNNNIKIEGITKVDIGFGLYGFLLTIRLDENLGSEKLKELLESDELIGEVRVEHMDRL